jgi:hypothetical protein
MSTKTIETAKQFVRQLEEGEAEHQATKAKLAERNAEVLALREENADLRARLNNVARQLETLRALLKVTRDDARKDGQHSRTEIECLKAALAQEKQAKDRAEQAAADAIRRAIARADQETRVRQKAEAQLLAQQEEADAASQEQAEQAEARLAEERQHRDDAEAERDQALELAARFQEEKRSLEVECYQLRDNLKAEREVSAYFKDMLNARQGG